jgi:osmotically-inducible protein OsmY
MRADSDIQRDVELELRYDPAIESRDIGASVRNRIVTLTGFVRSYTERFQAERDAKWVAGVAAIVDELEREEAERAAWQAPGVTVVENRLLVGDPALLP